MLEFLSAYKKYDPAARSKLEVLFLYPGVRVMAFYRIANVLHRLKIPFVPRLISEVARILSGIEIHPGARIGKNLIIDHGMGVVIGETSVIGDNVVIYQGVTLGGVSLAQTKRHPTLENNVVIGAGAKILGNITIGTGARVGANSVVLTHIPAGDTFAGMPARAVSASTMMEDYSV